MRLQLCVKGNEICPTENRTEFRPATLTLIGLRCLERIQRSFTLKERCGETLRDCQDSRLMTGIVGQWLPARKNLPRKSSCESGEALTNSIRALWADAVNQIQTTAFDKLSQVVE